METTPLAAMIAGMAAVTYAMRVGPALLLRGRPLPPICVQWMGFVPVAVLSAMVGPGLFLDGSDQLRGLVDNPTLWAAVPTAVLAWASRNFLATVVGGIGIMALLRAVAP